MITEKQRQERKKGIGGSEAAAVVGWSKFKSAYELWCEKTQDLASKQSKVMQLGNALEKHVTALYEKEMGVKVDHCDETIIHPDFKFIRANIDGYIAGKNIGVEIKTTAVDKNMNLQDLTENKDWLCQVAHYSEVQNFKEYHVFVYHRVTQQTKLYIYKPCESFQDALLKKEVDFFRNHIETLIPPSVETLKDIKKHFNYAEDLQAVANESVRDKMSRLIQLQLQKKEIQKEENEIKTDVFLEMGTANQLVDESGNYLASWKEVESNRFDTSSFKQAYPDLYEQFLTSSKTRRFLPNYRIK